VRPNGGIRIGLPFDPAVAWQDRDAYHVVGTIGGQRFRGPLKPGSPWTVELGPTWCREPGFGPSDEVLVEIALEGPQSIKMGEDVAQAFRDEPEAARFFDSMPTFYRNNVARSITCAKRPETRAKRISDAVDRAKARRAEGGASLKG
jgi:Bacteriocin-protection, YdeI or OmpD-Associated